jgi:hypothetical protein
MSGKPVVEFVILIANEHFIIEPDLLKNFFSKHRIASPLCITLIGWVSMFRIPDPHRVGHSRGNGLAEQTPPRTHRRSPHTGHLRMLMKKGCTSPQIIGGVLAMRAQDCDILATRLANAHIHRTRRNAPRVVNDAQLRMF